MVCLQNARSGVTTVTRFLRPSERVETSRGSLRAEDWLLKEKDRFARGGVSCEIVQTRTGRIALRKTQATG